MGKSGSAKTVTPFDGRKSGSETAALAATYTDIGALIADRCPDEPLFCFSRRFAEQSARRFRAGFPGLVTYAVKANPAREVLHAFVDAGITTFDVASPGEMALVRSICPTATLHYNNPIRSDAEIHRAITEFGVRHLVVDDLAGLERIAAQIADPGGIEISVRLRPVRNMAMHDFRSKFGAEPDDAKALLGAVAAKGFRTALTFHPGSQCTDPAAFVGLIFDAAGVAHAAGVTPDTLNVGGGFPARYTDTEAPLLDRYFADIRHAFARTFDADKTRLVCEPGRALAAPAMALLTRVKHVRENGDVFLNDGIYGGLMEFMTAPLKVPLRAWRGTRPLAGTTGDRRVYGPTCDPLDVLPMPLALPENIAPGDWLEFGLVGAYGISTTTGFNGYGGHETVGVDRILFPA
ncbi:MAG: ornithine decarboxylase [Hyphomicrobiales bacterium]|nr:MAG: ornithine decarboxylase [Hyphomicrobiales bacterium]